MKSRSGLTGIMAALLALQLNLMCLPGGTVWALDEGQAGSAAQEAAPGKGSGPSERVQTLRSLGFGAAADLLEAMESAGLNPVVSPDLSPKSASQDTSISTSQDTAPQGSYAFGVEITDEIHGASLKVVQRGKSVKVTGPYFLQSDRGDLYQEMALWAIRSGKSATQLPDGTIQVGPFETPSQALEEAEKNPQWNASCVGTQETQGGTSRLYYAVLRIDPSKLKVEPVFAGSFGMGRSTMSFLYSKSQGAVAMVNGGYYYNAYPLGTLVHKGIPMGRPIPGRSAVGVTDDGSVFFGDGTAYFGVSAMGTVMPITDFNIPPKNGNLSLFNHRIYRPISLPPGTTLLGIREGKACPIDEADFVLAGTGTAGELLSRIPNGEAVELIRNFAFPAFSSCGLVLQGGPMIVENRTYVSRKEGLSRTITHRRHPRTLVGVDDKGLVFMVIDGRNGHSDGVTLEEAARLAAEEGLTAALNLDGGGSSQMIWRSVTINKPSDRRERPLPYGLGVFPK
ncbi:MAG: phosphodiester glycosidase family protein [Thermanaerothrix sp.]|nr:phosphodiester glycosidase family protein [Thermanaerothrix sp.]